MTITGDMYPVGQVPQFAATGTDVAYYWVVVKESKVGSSVPLPIGFSQSDGKTAVSVAWPRVPGSNTISYDLLKTIVALAISWQPPMGSGTFAVSTNIAQCTESVCIASDSNRGASNYTVEKPSILSKTRFLAR